VQCKQRIESITDEIETLKLNYKNLIISIRPNMKDAYFADTLFDPNIDYSNVDRETMIETANACRKNWVHEHGISYNNLFTFKEQFELLLNELNNHKNINEKLSLIHENESDKLIELKTNINN